MAIGYATSLFTGTTTAHGQGFTTTAGGVAGYQMKEFYSRQLLERAKEILVFNEFGQKATIPRQSGVTIEWRRFAPLPLPAVAVPNSTTGTPALPTGSPKLAEATPGPGRGLAFEKITATVAQYGDFVSGSDLVDVTSIDPIISQATDLLAQQAAESIDVITREVLCGGTNILFCTRADGTVPTNFDTLYDPADTPPSVAPLSYATLVRARKIMFNKKARKIGAGYPMIIGSDAWENLMMDADLKATWNYGRRDNLLSGELGSYMGFDFRETTLSRIAAGTLAGSTTAYDVVYSHVIGADSYGTVALEDMGMETITKAKGSGGSVGDPLDMIWSQGWKTTHAAVILNQDWLLKILGSRKN